MSEENNNEENNVVYLKKDTEAEQQLEKDLEEMIDKAIVVEAEDEMALKVYVDASNAICDQINEQFLGKMNKEDFLEKMVTLMMEMKDRLEEKTATAEDACMFVGLTSIISSVRYAPEEYFETMSFSRINT